MPPTVIDDDVKNYLRLVAAVLIDCQDDDQWNNLEARTLLWAQLSEEQRATVNEMAEAIFGEWL
jgi:hypothetical protein